MLLNAVWTARQDFLLDFIGISTRLKPRKWKVKNCKRKVGSLKTKSI